MYDSLVFEDGADSEPAVVECLAMSEEAIPVDLLTTAVFFGSNKHPDITQQDWAREQRNDPSLNQVIDIKSQKHLSCHARLCEDGEVQMMLRVVDQFVPY